MCRRRASPVRRPPARRGPGGSPRRRAGQPIGEIVGGGLAVDGGGHARITSRTPRPPRAVDQAGDVQLVRADAVERRQQAAQHVVAAGEGRPAPWPTDRPPPRRRRSAPVAGRVGADGAGVQGESRLPQTAPARIARAASAKASGQRLHRARRASSADAAPRAAPNRAAPAAWLSSWISRSISGPWRVGSPRRARLETGRQSARPPGDRASPPHRGSTWASRVVGPRPGSESSSTTSCRPARGNRPVDADLARHVRPLTVTSTRPAPDGDHLHAFERDLQVVPSSAASGLGLLQSGRRDPSVCRTSVLAFRNVVVRVDNPRRRRLSKVGPGRPPPRWSPCGDRRHLAPGRRAGWP